MGVENDKKRDMKIHVSFGLILIIVSLGTWWYYHYSGSIHILFLSIFTSLITVSIILIPFKENNIINRILNIIGGVLGIVYLFTIIATSFVLVCLSSILVWVVFTVILKSIVWGLVYIELVDNMDLFELPILYCAILSALVSLSYFGDKIIVVVHKALGAGATNKNEIPRNIAKLILKYINVRRRLYELSIILYILSAVENMSTVSLIPFSIWDTYKKIALEVLIAFVAIDQYVSSFLSNSKK